MEENKKHSANEAAPLGGAEVVGLDPLDEQLRELWQPAPAAPPALRVKLLAMAEADAAGKNQNDTAPYDLAARRSELRAVGSARSRLAGPRQAHRGVSRGLAAGVAAVALLLGARVAVKQLHPHGRAGSAAATAQGADPRELTAEDEQFAMGGADDDDSDDVPSVVELAAEE